MDTAQNYNYRIAAQLAALNFDIAWLTYGRLRPLHTNAVIFAFGISGLFATSYYVVQRTCQANCLVDSAGRVKDHASRADCRISIYLAWHNLKHGIDHADVQVHMLVQASTMFRTAPSRCMKWRSRFGTNSTHWRTGRRGNTWSKPCAKMAHSRYLRNA